MEVFAIRDRAMDAYLTPFFVPSVPYAVRSFTDQVNSKDSPMFAHPEDYDLYHIASYVEDTGCIIPNGELRCVCRAQDVRIKE